MCLPNEANVLKALEQFESLYQLEQTTGTKTNRSRNAVLQKLNDADLTALAIILHRRGYIGPDGGAK